MALDKKIIEDRIKKNQDLITEILAEGNSHKPNPVIHIRVNAKPRPYTVEDFKKKYFISNLIGKD